MWDLLAEILLLISTAFVLGALAQRLKQSPILGYLMAGTIIGPLLFNPLLLKTLGSAAGIARKKI